jgi:hypothetical protein
MKCLFLAVVLFSAATAIKVRDHTFLSSGHSISVEHTDADTESCSGVTVFQHDNFQGSYHKFPVGNCEFHACFKHKFANDVVSSVKVPHGCKTVLYQHAHYQGWAITLTPGNYKMANIQAINSNFNDNVSSIKVQGHSLAVSHTDGEGSCKHGVTVYQHDNYNGISKTFPVGDCEYHACFKHKFPNDIVSSVKVAQGCTAKLYQHHHFQGWVIDLTAGNYRMGALQAMQSGFNDNLSSLKVNNAREARAPTCEGKAVTYSCPSGKSLDIFAASYGRHDGTTCPHSAVSDTHCNAAKSTKVVKDLCDGKATCQVSATNGVFGDPCVGTYKYLTVRYSCK